MNPRITKIEIIPISIPLNEPFVISKGALTHANNTIVIIHSDQGIFGSGECSPNRSMHGETQEGSVVVAQRIARILIGKNPFHIMTHVTNMKKLVMGNASIKSAFDMALYDLSAKLLELPLYTYLQAENTKNIKTDMTISLLDPEVMAEKASKYSDMGFPALKIKLGERPSSLDVKRIEAIRDEIGYKMPLRIDANQGWNYTDAIYALEEMADMNIQHCEEPLPYWNRIDQIKLAQESPIPIMADESVFYHHDAFQVLSENAATMLNIKLGKTGGICNGMKLGAVAEAADVYCQVGCFSESRLGISALAHFSCAWDHIIHYDMDAPLMLSEDPVLGGITYRDDWSINITDAPGHGASIDPKFLKRFETITIE